MKPICFYLIVIVGCSIFSGCSKPKNSDGLVKANVLSFEKENTSIEMKVQVCNGSDHSVFVTTVPFASCSWNVSGKKLTLESDFSYADNEYPNQVMCPDQARVDPSKCVTLIFKDERDEHDGPPMMDRNPNEKKNKENWKKWIQELDRVEKVDITFMYFEKEVTPEMVRAGYTKEFNGLMKKYGRHVTAHWTK